LTSEEIKFSRDERDMTVRMKIIQGMIMTISSFAYASTRSGLLHCVMLYRWRSE